MTNLKPRPSGEVAAIADGEGCNRLRFVFGSERTLISPKKHIDIFSLFAAFRRNAYDCV